MSNKYIAPLVESPPSSVERNYVAINTGSQTSRCFNKRDVNNFAFPEWREQFASNSGYASCQECAQASLRTGRYEQVCPSLREPRMYYQMGPLVSIKPAGTLVDQPYEFPLPYEYGKGTPRIDLSIQPWLGPP